VKQEESEKKKEQKKLQLIKKKGQIFPQTIKKMSDLATNEKKNSEM